MKCACWLILIAPFRDFCIIHIHVNFQPAVSIGNVGQLTIDLLIYNLDLKRVGYLYDSSILPLVGNDPFSSSGMQEGSLVTSAEGYNTIHLLWWHIWLIWLFDCVPYLVNLMLHGNLLQCFNWNCRTVAHARRLPIFVLYTFSACLSQVLYIACADCAVFWLSNLFIYYLCMIWLVLNWCALCLISVYKCDEKKLVAVQLRAPLAKVRL